MRWLLTLAVVAWARTRAYDKLIAPGARIEKMAGGFGFTLDLVKGETQEIRITVCTVWPRMVRRGC